MALGEDLVEMKSSRVRGDISREEYWEAVARALLNAKSVVGLLSNGTEVRIGSDGLLLDWTDPTTGIQLTFELDPGDIRTFPPTLIAEGNYEPVLSNLLFSMLRQSKTFVDVGANVGLYTVAAVRITDGIRVISYEPNPVVFSKLSRNLTLNNGLDKASLRNLAVSNEVNGSVDFFVPKLTGSGGGSMSNLHPEEGSPVMQRISTTTLDRDLHDLTEVDLMKVDVEGHEFKVMQGGLTIIKSFYPTIVIELLRKWMAPFGDHPQDVVALLRGAGYDAFAITDLGCESISEITDVTVATNFVFCHPSRPNHLATIKSALSLRDS